MLPGSKPSCTTVSFEPLIHAGYGDQLEQAVPPALARSARESAVAGVDAAQAAHSARLLEAVRDAFVGGMTVTLWAPPH
jgi:hypothetical protein